MKVLVTGGRTFGDEELLFKALDELDPKPTLIIEGGQRTYVKGKLVGGADYFAFKWALDNGVECVTVRANWSDLQSPPVKVKTRPNGSSYNTLAGFARNQRMVDMRPDVVVAATGKNGTKDCKKRARAAGIPIIEAAPKKRERADVGAAREDHP